ncbi:MAG: hypothetical protein IAE83_21895 [Anaerolinea sp.]|nr:hypothetical protein [Anaerolinea sp.]
MSTYNLSVKLNSTKDAQLIDYLNALPAGTKQAKVRELLYTAIMEERDLERRKKNDTPPTAPAAPALETTAAPEPTEQPPLTWQERLRQGLPEKAKQLLAGKKIMCISGSRDMTPEMRYAPSRVLWRAHQDGYTVVVGDAPGVDTEIINASKRLNIPIVIFGITAMPRMDTHGNAYVQVKRGNFNYRDQIMIDLADRWIGLWNGRSQGTAKAAQYARKQNKPAHLIAYSKSQPRRVPQQLALVH